MRDTFFPASSAATASSESPGTTTSTGQPVSLLIACAPAMVSKEARFSLPSRCSATTKMESAMGPSLHNFEAALELGTAAAQPCSVDARDYGEDARERHVVGHGKLPAGRVGEVLSRPYREKDREESALA